MENELKNECALLNGIANYMAEGVLALDKREQVAFLNPEASRLLGWRNEELVGQTLHSISHCMGDSTGCHCLHLRAMRDGEVIRCSDMAFRRKDGTRLAVACVTAPLLDNGATIGSVTVFRDITAEKASAAEQKALIRRLQEAQEQLLQAEKMASIGQLAAGVAHEINNPVGYINSNLTTLQHYITDLLGLIHGYRGAVAGLPAELPALAEVNEMSRRMDLDFLERDIGDLVRESLEGVARVKNIVQDLKDFSHVNGAVWQLTDLHHGLESTLNIVHNELKYKANVVKQYGELPLVECIGPQINQVFMNILVNAAQAIEQRGTISIQTGTGGSDKIWIAISDTGCGMPKEVAARVFEPFFTTKPVGKGTGLGLSVSYGIVKKHGGSIEVESKPGQGTTFRILLPIHRAPEAAANE